MSIMHRQEVEMFGNAPPRMPTPGMGNQIVGQGVGGSSMGPQMGMQGIMPQQLPPQGPGMPGGGQQIDPRIMAYIKALMG
jgi:hypothetical protein